MAKKDKYKIGDVFLINLENGLYCVGRILKKDARTVFLEIYKTKPIKGKDELDFEKIKALIPWVKTWCYDRGLVNGEWKIIANVPVEISEMPFFWTQDGSNRKYYLVKGTDECTGKFTGIEISKEDTKNYEPYGIDSISSLVYRYTNKLREEGLL